MALPEIRTFDANQPMVNYLSGQARQKEEAAQLEQTGYERDRQAKQDAFQQDKYQNTLAQQGIEQETARLKQEMQLDPFMKSKADEFLANINPDDPNFNQKVSDYLDMTGQRAKQLGFSDGSVQTAIQQAISSNAFTPEAIRRHRAGGGKEATPSALKKLITERDALVAGGADLESVEVKAYDNKINGTDINIEDMTPEEVAFWGAKMNADGKMPSFGRGKQATKLRQLVAKSAARQALGAGPDVPEGTPSQTPAEAALEVIGTQSDTKAIQGSLNFLDKQLSSMGSFVTNLNSQVDRVGELAEDLKTFDTRVLNSPLRAVRGKIAGSPLQAKYDMFLTEIESEIGKLATGSTGSVAELSATAQEKWESIHDKNLSVNDMLELLEETKNAANLRYESVQGQLDKTRNRMRNRGDSPAQSAGNLVTVTNPNTGESETWDLNTEQRVK